MLAALVSIWVRVLCACMTIACLAAGLGACGGVRSSTSATVSVQSSAASVLERDPTDRDDDRPGHPGDPDHDQGLTFGHAARVAEARAIEDLIHRYYTLAAAGRVRSACALQYWLLRESLAESLEQQGQHVSPAAACARLAAAAFAERHSEIAADAAAIETVQVRVRQQRGVALVVFAGVRERTVPVHREGTAWKLDALLDSGAP